MFHSLIENFCFYLLESPTVGFQCDSPEIVGKVEKVDSFVCCLVLWC